MSSNLGVPEADSIKRDTRDLHRGVLTNLLGYVIKLGNPVLLVFVVRLYGASDFGVFTFSQATMLLTARIAALGLDKALLWFIPRQSAEDKRRAIRSALLLTTLSALFATLIVNVSAAPIVNRFFEADYRAVTSLRIMAIAVAMETFMDVLIHAMLGMRRMGPQVFIKDTLVPTTFVVAALIFGILGIRDVGLSLAFIVSNAAGMAAAIIAFRRVFLGTRWPENESLLPPKEVTDYAGPMWLTEMANSLLQRADTYAVGLLTNDLAALGVYAVVTRFSNAIRQIRRSFDPIVLAIVSEVSSRNDPERLAKNYSHATFLVGITQIPVLAFLWSFADYLMPLFGPGFDTGVTPLVILCAFWILNSVVSLAGIVVSAYGYSRLSLYSVLVAFVVLCAACWLLIPPFGLVGAAYAVSIGYGVQGVMQLVQMKTVTKRWNYRPQILVPFLLGSGSAVAFLICMMVLRFSGVADNVPFVARSIAFCAFAGVYSVGIYRMWKLGRLARA
jgi:O-antigen/teichoic acid export membrane protein